MELIESLKPIFDFLIKYYLFHTILSIVFSLIIARIYYHFFLKENIETLKTEHENELLKEKLNFKEKISKLEEKYQEKIENLNNKLLDKDKEIQDLKLENVKLNNQQYIDYQLRQYSRGINNE